MPNDVGSEQRITLPRPKPGQPSKNERLAQIYQAAAVVIHEHGYDAASLNDIAKAAGLTKAGLYHYVSSKEGLLFEIMNFGMDLVDSDVLEPARAVHDPCGRLRTLVKAYANLVMEERHQAITIIINEANGLTPARRSVIRTRRQVFYQFVGDTIQQIKDEGEIEVLDVGVTTLNFVGCLVWLAYWYSPGGRLTKKQVTNEIMGLLVDRLVGLNLQTESARQRDAIF